ncbi:FtsX-like permease family protein [Microbacterium lacticum]
MQRYVIRMFADEWRQWVPAVAVVAVIATMIGLCVHQFAWTSDPQFRAAVVAAGVPLDEFRILSVTIYTVIALVSWVALTVVGRASVQATRRAHALWLLLGASPSTVFISTLLVLAVVSVCGAVVGALASTLLSFWAVPAFNAEVSPAVNLPGFVIVPWAPVAIIVLSVVTAMVGGLLPARRASRTPPSVALRSPEGSGRRSIVTVFRIVCSVFFLLVAGGLVVAAGFSSQLGSTSPGSMFNLAVDAGGSALIAVYLLCPQIVAFIFWILNGIFSRSGAVVPALGTRAAAARVQASATTIAPLAAGLGGIGLLLCAVNSVVAVTEALQPGTQTDLTEVWTIVAVIAASMLATSAAVVSLSARGRGREIALLQAAGMQTRQIGTLIASESFAIALAASITAAVPVAVGGIVCVLVSKAALGNSSVVVWPVPAMLLGLVAAWIVIFLILLAPAITPLRDGPGAQLREQGV